MANLTTRNPKGAGRKKLKREDMLVASLARDHTEEAIKTLVSLMLTGEPSIKRAAADSLLDRGWGKPAQAIAHTDADGENLPPTQYIMNINGVPKK